MADYIPQEVIVKILHLLPIKTLGQCLCVCKSWKSLIKSQDFIFTHLSKTHLTSPQNPLLLLRVCFDQKEHYSLHFDNPSFHFYKQLPSLALKCEIPNKYFRVISSCNGLICLADDLANFNEAYILWNPLIRKFKTLPKPLIAFDSHGPLDAFIGFGFDSKDNDYKLVRVVMLCALEVLEKPRPQVEVFSLNANSWKDLTAIAPRYEIFGRSTQAFVNEFIHFNAFRGDTNVVLGFHVGNEVFRQIRLPEDLANAMSFYISVSAYKESSIAVFHKDILGDVQWHVWVMREYGVFESWTKLLSIAEQVGVPTPIGTGLATPLGFRKNEDLVMENYDGEIIFLEPTSEEMKHLGIRGKKPGCYSFVSGHVETLALLDRLKKK